jgi:hypothetical protein
MPESADRRKEDQGFKKYEEYKDSTGKGPLLSKALRKSPFDWQKRVTRRGALSLKDRERQADEMTINRSICQLWPRFSAFL